MALISSCAEFVNSPNEALLRAEKDFSVMNLLAFPSSASMMDTAIWWRLSPSAERVIPPNEALLR